MGREWLDLGAKLRSLDDELEKARDARRRAEAAEQQVGRLRREYEAKEAELKQFASREKERLRSEEESFLRKKRREVENLVREIRESGAERDSVVQAKARIEHELAEVSRPAEPEPLPETSEPVAVKPGDTVRSRTFDRLGTVVERTGDRVVVAFGQIKMELGAHDVKFVEAGGTEPEPSPVAQEPYRFESNLNIRGMTRDEADAAVGRFLDEAALNSSLELFIVHGKGTGALRQMLWNRLRRDPRVEKIRLGEAAEGGSGVTLVTLKVTA
jgi:DNA mismatch repair protein MutS2